IISPQRHRGHACVPKRASLRRAGTEKSELEQVGGLLGFAQTKPQKPAKHPSLRDKKHRALPVALKGLSVLLWRYLPLRQAQGERTKPIMVSLSNHANSAALW